MAAPIGDDVGRSAASGSANSSDAGAASGAIYASDRLRW